MLVAHHIIDVLRGKVKHPSLMPLPGVDIPLMKRTADLIERAHKFDFGELILEVKEQLPTGPLFTLPALTVDEREFWREGLIPLPFEVCWFEFTLNRSRPALLVREVGTEWQVERIDYASEILYDGIICTADRAKQDEEHQIKMSISGNTRLFERLQNNRGGSLVANSNVAVAPILAIYFSLMLNSKTTEAVQAPSPAAGLNRSRARRGRAPLQEHSIITIVPARFRGTERGDGKGAPRRLHWRRSHIRHYDRNTPASRWAPEMEHAGKKGWWVAVIPRMLVGHADLGEVSHEYRVAQVPHSETEVPA